MLRLHRPGVQSHFMFWYIVHRFDIYSGKMRIITAHLYLVVILNLWWCGSCVLHLVWLCSVVIMQSAVNSIKPGRITVIAADIQCLRFSLEPAWLANNANYKRLGENYPCDDVCDYPSTLSRDVMLRVMQSTSFHSKVLQTQS